MKKIIVVIIFVIPLLFVACDKGEDEVPAATPYTLVIPQGLPPMNIPSNNPLTVEGIALGKRLFYDPILSANNTQSCASCHVQENGFSETTQYSTGIDGIEGNRNAMPLINLGWQTVERTDWKVKSLGPSRTPLKCMKPWRTLWRN